MPVCFTLPFSVFQFIDLSSAITLGTLENDNSQSATNAVNSTNIGQRAIGSAAALTNAVSNVVSSGGVGNPVNPSNSATLTVLASGTTAGGAKTIVVVPVSSATGAGDAQTAKRLKTS